MKLTDGMNRVKEIFEEYERQEQEILIQYKEKAEKWDKRQAIEKEMGINIEKSLDTLYEELGRKYVEHQIVEQVKKRIKELHPDDYIVINELKKILDVRIETLKPFTDSLEKRNG